MLLLLRGDFFFELNCENHQHKIMLAVYYLLFIYLFISPEGEKRYLKVVMNHTAVNVSVGDGQKL